MEAYENTILQKMYRDFTLDETVLFMKGIISKQSIEIGALKSDIAEHTFNYNKLQASIKNEQHIKAVQPQQADTIRTLRDKLKAERLLSRHYKNLCLSHYIDVREGEGK